MDDTIDLMLALLLLPLAIAMFGCLLLGVTAPKRDDGVWMYPLGSESWVSPRVRLTGIIALHFLFLLSGFSSLDSYSRSGLGNDSAWVEWGIPVTNALVYLAIGRLGIRNSWEYLSSPTRAASRKRLLVELLFLGTHFMFLVLGVCFSAVRISQALGVESDAYHDKQVSQYPSDWSDTEASERMEREHERERRVANAFCPKQQCANQEWYLYCSRFLPEDAPRIVCPTP
ncbi:MAG: hypothetical protein OXP09_04390 [Gammaproteobacteria bacterium]|nr:hypothetical protein [Gammaproteobacteria bacterium]